MADIQLDTEAAPSTPSSGSAFIYVDSTTKLLSAKNDAGVVQTVPLTMRNRSVTSQTGSSNFSADSYLVGSAISIPSGYPHVGTKYRMRCDITKTGAGTATPIVTVRIGTAGTTSDTAICQFTFSAGTANADTGILEVDAVFRTVGSGTSAVLQGMAAIYHGTSATTGLVSLVSDVKLVTSSGFDSTVASSIIGVSVNGGASASWTVQLVDTEFTSL